MYSLICLFISVFAFFVLLGWWEQFSCLLLLVWYIYLYLSWSIHFDYKKCSTSKSGAVYSDRKFVYSQTYKNMTIRDHDQLLRYNLQLIIRNICTFQRDTQCICTDCLLILRCQLYMFRTVTVHPQELLFRCCMCRLWYVLIRPVGTPFEEE